MTSRPHFQKLVERARLRAPLTAAVVFPCDREALQMALSGAFAGYLRPTLVGPEMRIRDIALKAGLDISRLDMIDTPDDARAAGVRAVELARDGEVAALIKGSLAKEDLLNPVVAQDSGLRTERRLSHAYFLDLPDQPRGHVLADAQMNVAPNLAAKRDIVVNTIQLATALGIASPNVALLAAMDGPATGFPSTMDAVALRVMAQQGKFPGAKVEGPLTPDAALSADVARARGVQSEIAGQVDVLVAPAMESALMVLRTMLALGGGLAAGLVLGARVPIVVPARYDTMEVRMASCVLASLFSSWLFDASKSDQSTLARDTGTRAAA